MNWITALIGVLLALVLIVRYVPPKSIAGFLRSFKTIIPATIFLLGLLALVFGRITAAFVLMTLASMVWRRWGGATSWKGASGSGQSRFSSVRSAALEMELDHDTGEMNGLVLVGSFEGKALQELSEEELHLLHKEIEDDAESVALLDSYFDRRFPGWREDAEANTGAGQAGPSSSGPMGEEEAYEVLGLAAGATAAEIRQAHRRLMKAAHPDSGGSTFLASKINEAKDVLLRSHS